MIFPKQTFGHFTYFQKQSLYQVLFSSVVFVICGHLLIWDQKKMWLIVQIFNKFIYISPLLICLNHLATFGSKT